MISNKVEILNFAIFCSLFDNSIRMPNLKFKFLTDSKGGGVYPPLHFEMLSLQPPLLNPVTVLQSCQISCKSAKETPP